MSCCPRCVEVSDEGVEAVAAGCRQLRVLRLYANQGITDVGVKSLAQLPHLQARPCRFCLPDMLVNSRISKLCLSQPMGRPALPRTSHSAQGVSRCPVPLTTQLVTRETESHQALRVARVQVLDVTGAHALSGVGVAALAACHELTHLALTWCIRVDDAGVVALAAGARGLQLLSLHGLQRVTDRWAGGFLQAVGIRLVVAEHTPVQDTC